MTQITFRDWILDCDLESTRTAYESIAAGGLETCECAGCKNFLAQRDLVFPTELMNLFTSLGIDYKRDAEIYHITRLDSGLHQYGGWFHFIGHVAKEPIGPATIDHFTVDFVPGRGLAAKAFEDRPLIQLEITAEVPWVLPDKEID